MAFNFPLATINMLCCVLAAAALLPILGPAFSRLAGWLFQPQDEASNPCCEGEDCPALMKSGHTVTTAMFTRRAAFIATLAGVIVISVLSAIVATGGAAEAEPDLWLEALGSWCRPPH